MKEEFLSPEELRKREEALAAAKAWEEATEKQIQMLPLSGSWKLFLLLQMTPSVCEMFKEETKKMIMNAETVGIFPRYNVYKVLLLLLCHRE